MPFRPDDEARFEYTRRAEEHEPLKRAAAASGRHLINRNTDVLNGVWGGDYDAESLVVDYSREADYYNALAEELKQRASQLSASGGQRLAKTGLLSELNDFVRQKMPYSLSGVQDIYHHFGGTPGKKISLAYYIEKGVGVCAHQALFAATLMEILRLQGDVGGVARVNRSIQWPQVGEPGGHAWVRYTNSAEQIYIIDPAQNFVGSLKEAAARDRGWNYRLPEDIDRPDFIKIGSTAAHKIITPDDIPR